MLRKFFIGSAFLSAVLLMTFTGISESFAQGTGGSYDTRSGKLTERKVDDMDIVELNGRKILEGKIREVFNLRGADVAVASSIGNVNCPTGFNFITFREYDKPQVSDWIPACYDARGEIRQEGQDIVLRFRESVGTYAVYRYSGGNITKTQEVSKVGVTDDQCRTAYKVYTEKCKGLTSAMVIDRHLYFYKDALNVDQFFNLCSQASEDTWTPVSYDEFKGRVCKMQD
jgi:hypothetical protein